MTREARRNGGAYETQRRAVRLRRSTWEQFKTRYLGRGISPATRVGQLVELDLGGTPEGADDLMHLSRHERQLIWTALALRARTMPLRAADNEGMRRVIAEAQETMRLRDRFATAFTPPRKTMYEPGVPAG